MNITEEQQTDACYIVCRLSHIIRKGEANKKTVEKISIVDLNVNFDMKNSTSNI